MLGAYYSKGVDSSYFFDNLKISSTPIYDEHLNQYNVINISFNKIPDKRNTFNDYMNMIKTSLIKAGEIHWFLLKQITYIQKFLVDNNIEIIKT